MKTPPVVIGNWKMNPTSLSVVTNLVKEIGKISKKYPTVTTAVAPPFPFLAVCNKVAPALTLVAQTMHDQPLGAFTGEVSPTMLTGFGVKGVIIGHSERRTLGESNETIAKKVQSAIKYKLTPVICIGEKTRDDNGNFFSFIEVQLVTALMAVPKNKFKAIIIAYEPIWAIGTGVNASAEDVVEMQLFIVKVLTKHFGRSVVPQVRIIYGGSVNDKNVSSLWTTGHLNGFLVGGASLRAESFKTIIKIVADNSGF